MLLIHSSINKQKQLVLTLVILLEITYNVDVNKWDLIFDFTKNDSGKLNYSFVDPSEF